MSRSGLLFTSPVVLLLGTAAMPCAAQYGLLDGRATVADSEELNPPGDFTLEAWIKPTLFSSYQSFIYKWVGSGSAERSYLLGLNEDRVRFVVTATGTYEVFAAIVSNEPLVLNEWAHVAGVCTGGTLTLFINGQQDPQVPYLPGGAFQGQAPVYIGGTHSASYERFRGAVDEVRISYVARYSGSFSVPMHEFVPDSDTMLLMHFNEGAGTFTDNVGLLCGDGFLDGSSGWGEGAPFASWSAGDLNCDGLVNAFDIDPFVLALTYPPSYEAAYPECNVWLADCDGDGWITAFDIDPFVLLLTGGQ